MAHTHLDSNGDLGFWNFVTLAKVTKLGLNEPLWKGFGVWISLMCVSKWDSNIWLLFTRSQIYQTSKIGHKIQNGPKRLVCWFDISGTLWTKSQMLASHFDTYINGIQTPKPFPPTPFEHRTSWRSKNWAHNLFSQRLLSSSLNPGFGNKMPE